MPPKKSLPFISLLLPILGGLLLVSLFLRTAVSALHTWSPVKTAEVCFPYPEKEKEPLPLPEQFFFSQFFFSGRFPDFDLGEENTGVAVLPEKVKPMSDTQNDERLSPADQLLLPETEAGDRSYENKLLLRPIDLSGEPAEGEILVSDFTQLDINGNDYLLREYPIKRPIRKPNAVTASASADPLVLIIHTHGTEAFSPENVTEIPADSLQRSTDPTKNVVAVGKILADRLNQAGIPTLHCEIEHDAVSYNDSYLYASETIVRYLTEYPSIQYVFDIHRDAVADSQGNLWKPICQIDGHGVAQIMLVVGTNEGGADHPDWEKNMTVAAHLQQKLTAISPSLARPINLRNPSFNEQFTNGSLLIEIGSSANSLAEVSRAAEYLSQALIALIKP